MKKYKQTAGNVLLLLLSCLCLLFFIIELADYYHDDAYIILRYAKKIPKLNGPVVFARNIVGIKFSTDTIFPGKKLLSRITGRQRRCNN